MADNTEMAEAEAESRGKKLKQAAEKTRDAVAETLTTAREKLHEAAETAKERAGKASEVARERYAQLSEQARERYAHVSEQAQQRYQRARKSVDDLAGNVNEYVRDNPGKSVMIAAGVGFLVGLLMRGARRRDS